MVEIAPAAVLSAGFLIVRPVARPPDQVISASDCICPRFPGPYAISWCATSDEDRAKLLSAVGVPAHRHAEAVEWATAAFDEAYGWPGVFYSVDAARAARDRFFPQPGTVKVLGLGLAETLVGGFIEEATPPASPPGFAPNGESGYLECVRRRTPLPEGGRALGFEPLNLQLGMLEDSWLCNRMEHHCASTLQVRPASNGLVASLEAAARCCDEINRDDVGAEPGPWYPFLLVEY